MMQTYNVLPELFEVQRPRVDLDQLASYDPLGIAELGRIIVFSLPIPRHSEPTRDGWRIRKQHCVVVAVVTVVVTDPTVFSGYAPVTIKTAVVAVVVLKGKSKIIVELAGFMVANTMGGRQDNVC